MKKIILPLLMIIIPLLSYATPANVPTQPLMDQTKHALIVTTTSSYNTFELLSVDGKVVYSTLIGNAGNNQIDVSLIASGTYVYRISGNESASGELVITH